MSDWRESIGDYLTLPLKKALRKVAFRIVETTTDLRIRANQPALLCGRERYRIDTPPITADEIRLMADAMLGHSMHTHQEELRQGFVTLPSGFRAGFTGRAVLRDGKLVSMRDISSISIRVARELRGAATALMPWLFDEGCLCNALILSMPGLGKTTMLRDTARLLSAKGYSISIVDERSELAACVLGVPSLDVGENTDVLDGCPKAEGMRLLLRAMAPNVIITDELGSAADAAAVREVARCGVAVIASVHGRTYRDLEERPMMRAIMQTKVFTRFIALEAVGHIGAVYDAVGDRLV